jgi:hypothetical protein
MKVGVMICASIMLAAGSVPAMGIVVFGQGTVSCGAWTQERQANSHAGGLAAQWVAGYLSGMNEALNMGPDQAKALSATPNALAFSDALEGTDFDGLMAWMDNYCRADPLSKLYNAAYQLLRELRSRARPK